MAKAPDKDRLRGLDPLKELRMVLAIGQRPEMLLCVDGKPVGACVNVDVDIEDGSVVARADFEVTQTLVASGVMLRLPSGAEFYVAYDNPAPVTAGSWINTNGTITLGAT